MTKQEEIELERLRGRLEGRLSIFSGTHGKSPFSSDSEYDSFWDEIHSMKRRIKELETL